MVSKAREDLPEPERPGMTVSVPRGRWRSIFFRLWVRAPRMRIWPAEWVEGRLAIGSLHGAGGSPRSHCVLEGMPPYWGGGKGPRQVPGIPSDSPRADPTGMLSARFRGF